MKKNNSIYIPKKRLNYEWLRAAIKTIKLGFTDKLENNGVSVYKCGRVIRVDIKSEVWVD